MVYNSGRKHKLRLKDLYIGLIMVGSVILLQYIDAAHIYHAVRGQSVVKLYVIFNVFEVHFLSSFFRVLKV